MAIEDKEFLTRTDLLAMGLFRNRIELNKSELTGGPDFIEMGNQRLYPRQCVVEYLLELAKKNMADDPPTMGGPRLLDLTG